MASKTGVAIAEIFKNLAVDIGQIEEFKGDVDFEQSASQQVILSDQVIERTMCS